MTIPLPAVSQRGVGAVSADLLNSFVQNVSSLAQLRGLVGLTGMVIYLQGTVSPSDGGQGFYVYNASSTATDNGTTVIKPTSVTNGRWLYIITAGGNYSNVSSFGYVDPTGITDSSAGFLAAIAHGQPFFVQPGTYLISSQLLIGTGGVTIFGAGQGATILLFNFANQSAIKFYAPAAAGTTGDGFSGGGGNGFFYGGVQNLSIAYTNGLTPTSGYGIEVNNTSAILMQNVTITGGYGGGASINCGVTYWFNVSCANQVYDGFYVAGTPDVYLTSCTAGQFTVSPAGNAGYHFAECGGAHITDCTANTEPNSILLKPSSGKGVHNIIINNCDFDNAQSDSFVCDTSLGGWVYDVSMTSGRSGYCGGAALKINGGYNYMFSAVDFVYNVGPCVSILGGSQISLAACNIIGGSSLGGSSSNLEVRGGDQITITGGTISTVWYTAGSTIPTNAPYGILFSSAFTGNFSLTGGNLQSGVTSFISDSSTGATIQIAKCQGFKSESSGAASMPTSTTSLAVAHGLSGTPTSITTSVGVTGYTIGAAPGAANITLTMNPANGGGATTIYWTAKTKYA
jgi:hypothetical protein